MAFLRLTFPVPLAIRDCHWFCDTSRVTSDSEARAQSFGAQAERYDRTRPQYPPELVDALIRDGAAYHASPDGTVTTPPRVLDVGCGTGVAARGFVDRGWRVHGVEHDPRMAEVARRHGLQVDVGKFEDWMPPIQPYDLVISGQAWHWIDRNQGPRKAADALRPGGELAIFWIEYHHSAEVSAAFTANYTSIVPGLLHTSHPLGQLQTGSQVVMVQEYASAIRDSGCFDAPLVREYPSVRRYSTDDWIDELPTHSDHLLLPESVRRTLFTSLRLALDRIGGQFDVEFTTHLVSAHRLTP